MTLEQALHFWFGRINYEQKSPQASDLTLDRMRALLALLGQPQDRFRIVHVAGSKGKGSTAAMLACILQRAGYRTGLFTSPHLMTVEERIQVDGHSITPAELTQRLTDIQQACRRAAAGESLAERLTFFEIAAAVGFLHFAARRVEVAVLEVGLGGRFDSTNVCRPLVSVITTISFDHTQQLGNTLASIAGEKAGIIKPGRPVVSGVRAPEARAVIERVSREQAARLTQLDRDFAYAYQPAHITADRTELGRVRYLAKRSDAASVAQYELNLVGEHQAANAALALATVIQLRAAGLSIPESAVAQGLAQVHWPGRLEVLRRRPLVVVDCAHNVDSAAALLEALLTSFPTTTAAGQPLRRHLIFAASRDKDLAGMLRVLAPAFEHVVFTRFGNNPRCVPPDQAAALLPPGVSPHITLTATVPEAWSACQARAAPEDLICVTGSVFLAGEFRQVCQAENP